MLGQSTGGGLQLGTGLGGGGLKLGTGLGQQGQLVLLTYSLLMNTTITLLSYTYFVIIDVLFDDPVPNLQAWDLVHQQLVVVGYNLEGLVLEPDWDLDKVGD